MRTRPRLRSRMVIIGSAGRLVGHFIYTKAVTQASFTNAAEFFNSLLVLLNQKKGERYRSASI